MSILTDARQRELADLIDELDQGIKDLNDQKRDLWSEARDEMKGLGADVENIRTALAGLKGAISRRRALRENPDKTHDKDAAIDEALAAIMPRACTHVGTHDADHSTPSHDREAA